MRDKMIGSKAIRGRGGCDCKDCSVPKRTQRSRETKIWTEEYLEEMDEDND